MSQWDSGATGCCDSTSSGMANTLTSRCFRSVRTSGLIAKRRRDRRCLHPPERGLSDKVKILSISNKDLWPGGENKGIPSIFFAQREFAARGHAVHFLCPLTDGKTTRSLTDGINIYRFDFPFNFRKNLYFQTDNILTKLKASMLYRLNRLFFQVFSLRLLATK